MGRRGGAGPNNYIWPVGAKPSIKILPMGSFWPRVPRAALFAAVGVPVVVAMGLPTGCAVPPSEQSRYWGPIERAPDARAIDDPRSPGDSGRNPDPDPDPEPEPEPPPATDAASTLPPPRTDGGAVASACSLRVSVTTVSTGRDYRPRNIGAIWVTDGNNRFVKTLSVWANRRIASLAQWNTVTSAAGLSRNRVDAVSAATVNNHNTPHTATWSCTNARREPVPDGTYRICFEMTESNRGDSPSRFNCAEVVKGPEAFDRMLPDDASFRGRRLQFTP
jgi:hypothetical protein